MYEMLKDSELKKLTKKINTWVRERDWEKFQIPKDLAISLSLEAAEVLEHFQWKSDKAVKKHIKKNKEEIADELADVGIYLLNLADKIGVDLGAAIERKLIKQSKKYPVNTTKVKGLREYYRRKNIHRKKKVVLFS